MRVDTGFPGKRGLCAKFADFGLMMIFAAFCAGFYVLSAKTQEQAPAWVLAQDLGIVLCVHIARTSVCG
jgi:hypothetical protein